MAKRAKAKSGKTTSGKTTGKAKSTAGKSAGGGKKAGVAAAAKQSFVSGLVARGEAKRAPKGNLPSGATHEIVGVDEAGAPTVVRRRFSAF